MLEGLVSAFLDSDDYPASDRQRARSAGSNGLRRGDGLRHRVFAAGGEKQNCAVHVQLSTTLPT